MKVSCYGGQPVQPSDFRSTAPQIMFADALKSRLMAEERFLEGGTRGYQLQRAAALAADVYPPTPTLPP